MKDVTIKQEVHETKHSWRKKKTEKMISDWMKQQAKILKRSVTNCCQEKNKKTSCSLQPTIKAYTNQNGHEQWN